MGKLKPLENLAKDVKYGDLIRLSVKGTNSGKTPSEIVGFMYRNGGIAASNPEAYVNCDWNASNPLNEGLYRGHEILGYEVLRRYDPKLK